ncbi:molybdate ABC transporter permease subunit [Paenibacillus thalictri]|uniref:Molybdenum transport system permease n=1 Tax=Paenibacillus thalictri TaxID=2527873 RepID=A0A4V2J4Z8_9BACL|nr:molybdate ABC transporter permease subunit [Paenibacillus thalictri]TBL81782.1 molybdate ABC transporter permease subunit [Paenibacillus thalictri]
MSEPIDWEAFWQPIELSLRVALTASPIVLVAGALAAWLMAKRRFPGKALLETVFLLPLVLPPSVVGFVLLVSLGRNSPIGTAIERLFGEPIVFSWWAAAVASIVVAFPLAYQTLKTGFAAVDGDLEDSARSMGARERQVFFYVTLPLTWRFVVSAAILGFARSLGEFGATLMIAGNIPGKTQTVPTAIYIAVESGKTAAAWYWTTAIVGIAFVLLFAAGRQK